MARKTQISKAVILEAAFQFLLREGYSSVNIKSLAKEIGCSTQPISWHFNNMDGLRKELLEYCVRFIGRIFCGIGNENVAKQLEDIAYGYITLAFDYPNLYRYIYINDYDGRKMNQMTGKMRETNYDRAVQMIQKEYGTSEQEARNHMINMQMYVHGVAGQIVLHGGFSSKEEVMKMIHRANETFLLPFKLRNQEVK